MIREREKMIREREKVVRERKRREEIMMESESNSNYLHPAVKEERDLFLFKYFFMIFCDQTT